MGAEGPAYLVVGMLLRPHGVHGGVVVMPLTDQDRRFDPGARLLLGPERLPVTVAEARPYKGRLLVRLEEIPNREAAESHKRAELAITAADVGPPPEGAVWARDLEGLPVRDPAGRDRGRVLGVESNPAHDVLLCEDPEGRPYAVPMVRALMDPVAPGVTEVVVRPIPGLLPEDTDTGMDTESDTD